MRVSAAVIGFLVASTACQVIAQEAAGFNETDDQMAYVMSFTAPAMAGFCTSVMPSYSTELEASLPGWRVRNGASIERGKQTEISHLWPGKTIEDFEQLAIEATKDSLKGVTMDQQLLRCRGMLMVLSDPTGAGGA
jgi:hypothetical protein